MDNLEKIEIYKKGIASQFVDEEFKEQMRSKIAELEGATAPQTTQEEAKVEVEAVMPVFDFMKSSPMGQGKSIKLLSKLIRADGLVLTNYKWIEGFEKGLKVETSKIHSSKSEKGYVEKPVIGNHIVESKAEQDYYVYLENGGETYTKFLERKNDYDSVIAKKENAERDIRNAERESKQKEANEKYKLAKQNEIKSYIENGIEPTLSKRLSFFQNKIEQLKSKRSSDIQKEELAFNERMIEQTKKQVQNSYKIATELYVIINGEVEKKYDWKVGDKVLYDERIETAIEQVTVNHLLIEKDVAYKVEKREGIHNQYIIYDGLFPVSLPTQEAKVVGSNKEEENKVEIIDDKGNLETKKDNGKEPYYKEKIADTMDKDNKDQSTLEEVDKEEAEKELIPYRKLAKKIHKNYSTIHEGRFMFMQNKLVKNTVLSKNTQDYFSKKYGTDKDVKLISQAQASENFILDSVKKVDVSLNSDKQYFQSKLKAIKIVEKFADMEEKMYFSDLKKAIKISLKYL